ncbi:MAG: GIY-YIG nuclease family protein [Anaerolineales bacterium]|nr:GIY-YIG nuclease family protein [Anaerolineales bacterium]
MTNWKHTVLYTGVTNNLARRVEQHRNKQGSTFTSRYGVTKLVFVEVADQIHAAIAREKQIKAGSR